MARRLHHQKGELFVRAITIGALLCCCALAQPETPKAFRESPLVRDRQYVLWHDPGAVESLDFRNGIGGEALVPKPPFKFVDEDMSGSTPKIAVKDANGRNWSVKFGDEASPDTFCTRMAWAMGYYATPAYFIEEGAVEGATNLKRARGQIDKNGRFEAARFQLRSKTP